MELRVVLAEHSGFCFGVKRAITIAQKTAEESRVPVYTYGPLIHNPQVVERLGRDGVKPIDSFDGLGQGKLIIRSHGVAPDIVEEARRLGLEVVDATCPFVRKAQEFARSLQEEGYKVLVVGEANHPEVMGIVGYTSGHARVMDHNRLPGNLDEERIGVISQTTVSLEAFKLAVSKILDKAREVKIYNTTCSATHLRRSSTLRVASNADLMVVVGGLNSANTTRLAELCEKAGVETHHIETSSELDRAWFRGRGMVGVTAGASTPDWIIKEVVKVLRRLN